jgi:hypothetical protein
MKKCNVCTSSNVELILSLPSYPLNTLYLTCAEKENGEKYKSKDFSVYMCKDCGHFQGISAVKLSELYNDEYNYHTQNTGVQGRISYFLSQLDHVSDIKFNRVIDIGCYDLSLLKAVKKKVKADFFIGIDPSIPDHCLNNSENIVCIKDYVDSVNIPHFNEEMPDLILSDQTFEHIPTIYLTLGNIVQKTGKDSVFAICVPSLEVLVEKLNFHNLIHEHVNYFSIHTLSWLFYLNKLTLDYYNLNYTSTCGFLFALFTKNSSGQNKIVVRKNEITKECFLLQYDLFNQC